MKGNDGTIWSKGGIVINELSFDVELAPMSAPRNKLPGSKQRGGGEGRGFLLSLVQKVGGSGFKMIEVKVRFGSEY